MGFAGRSEIIIDESTRSIDVDRGIAIRSMPRPTVSMIIADHTRFTSAEGPAR
jgi:hypothetical protein